MRQVSYQTPTARHVAEADQRTAPWWPIFRDLRDARNSYGLKARHLTTLAALLSFLRDANEQMTVFASNRSILERLNGLCERTFQRHIAQLAEAGLLRRNDSSNGKRFRLRGPGKPGLSYGFDLSPLMEKAPEIALRAKAERDSLAYAAILRQQVLMLLSSDHLRDVDAVREMQLRQSLRRKQPVAALEAVLSELQSHLPNEDTCNETLPEQEGHTDKLSASDSQIVGHIHKSTEEDIDRYRGTEQHCSQSTPNKLLELLRKACPSARTWLHSGFSSWSDILSQVRQLASWIGISNPTYSAAEEAQGRENAAATLFAILERAEKIRHPAAYFYAVTVGKRSKSFNADRMLGQLLAVP